jgi:hypothetical protein
VVERANARKTELATLQVTQENLQELTLKLQRFSDQKTQPRTASAERAARTNSLESLIREANSILRDQIDRMVNLFSRTDPQFVSGYQARAWWWIERRLIRRRRRGLRHQLRHQIRILKEGRTGSGSDLECGNLSAHSKLRRAVQPGRYRSRY